MEPHSHVPLPTSLLQVQPSQDTQGSPSGSSSSGSNHGGKAKKPKGLELTPTLVVTSSEPSPLSLASPSLPTASLTPAFLQVSVSLKRFSIMKWIHKSVRLSCTVLCTSHVGGFAGNASHSKKKRCLVCKLYKIKL